MRANREPDRTIELDREGLQIGARSVHRLLPARVATARSFRLKLGRRHVDSVYKGRQSARRGTT
jgi:hypothetical protein